MKYLSLHPKTTEIISWKKNIITTYNNKVLWSRRMSLTLLETSTFQVIGELIKFYYGTVVSRNISAIILIRRLILVL